MKILVVLPRFPYPLDKGDKLRAYHQIVELSKRHDIYLFSLSHQKVQHDNYNHLQTYCTAVNYTQLHWWESAWGIFKAFLNGQPLQSGYWNSCRARRAYAKWEREIQPDVVYCQMVSTIPTIGYPLPATRYVLDFQDALSLNTHRRMECSHGMLKWILRYEYKALQRMEQEALRRFDATTIICSIDRDAISSEVALVPNGVDTDFFRRETFDVRHETAMPLSSHYSLVFTGNMSYAPNVDAARFLVMKIMPLVWKHIPSATVLLAGADPKPAVRMLASERVFVSGRLNDIRQAYASSEVFVAPMRIGSGLQNKLLEAMAMQLPCVTTSLAGNPILSPLITPSFPFLVGDDTQTLAEHLIRLLTDKQYANNLADEGNRFVQKHYSWSAAVAPLEKILNSKL